MTCISLFSMSIFVNCLHSLGDVRCEKTLDLITNPPPQIKCSNGLQFNFLFLLSVMRCSFYFGVRDVDGGGVYPLEPAVWFDMGAAPLAC